MKIKTIQISNPLNSAIPKEKGSYLFVFHISKTDKIEIGRLGTCHIPTGFYHYCGSAHGGGGIYSRVMRHLNPSAPKHWHIDYLKAIMLPVCIHYTISSEPLECIWSQILAVQPSASVPIPGFGASDCKSHCPAHLIRLDTVITSRIFHPA